VNRERHLDRAPLAVLEHDRFGQRRAAARQRFQQLEAEHVLGVAQPYHRPPLGRAALLQPQHPGRPRRGVAERQRVARLHLGEVVQVVGIDHELDRRHAGHDPPADGVDVERFEQHGEPPGGDRVVGRAALEVDLVLELLQVGRRPDDRFRQGEDGEPWQCEAAVVPHPDDAGLAELVGRVGLGVVLPGADVVGGVHEAVERVGGNDQPLAG
jgi:hypothetical protein